MTIGRHSVNNLIKRSSNSKKRKKKRKRRKARWLKRPPSLKSRFDPNSHKLN